MRISNTNLRPSGHPEHEEYRISRDYLVSDTGNGGDTAYSLLHRTTDFPPSWDMDAWAEIATGPTLESVVRAYENL